jgi:hypothetical protein
MGVDATHKRSWEGLGFSRAVTIPMNSKASAPEGPAHAAEKTSTPEIESQRTARRREQAGVFPTARMRSSRGKSPPRRDLGRATIESKMNVVVRATRPRSQQLKTRYTATLWQHLSRRGTL